LADREDAGFLAGATWFAVTATFMIVFIRALLQRSDRAAEQLLLPERRLQDRGAARLILTQAPPSRRLPPR